MDGELKGAMHGKQLEIDLFEAYFYYRDGKFRNIPNCQVAKDQGSVQGHSIDGDPNCFMKKCKMKFVFENYYFA